VAAAARPEVPRDLARIVLRTFSGPAAAFPEPARAGGDVGAVRPAQSRPRWWPTCSVVAASREILVGEGMLTAADLHRALWTPREQRLSGQAVGRVLSDMGSWRMPFVNALAKQQE